MIKITEQYFWNLVLLSFWGMLVVMGAIILDTEARIPFAELTLLDIALVTLATWRLTRFVSSDTTTKFFREQFYDLKKTARSYSLEVPTHGPRRTVLEVLMSPWNLSLGLGSLLIFVYLLTSFAMYPVALLALSGLVGILDTGTNFLARKNSEE